MQAYPGKEGKEMIVEQLKNLEVPKGKIDVVLDTDAYNEIDDQFAISYMLRSYEKLNVKAICAAPFFNNNSTSPEDGMERSYQEILKLLKLADREDMVPFVYRGSSIYLKDEKTPVESEAARKIVEIAKEYTPEKPLYVVEIAAITTVASALLLAPEIADRIVIVWLGGHALSYHDTYEFNMMQDFAAARVVFESKAALVQLPCMGVVSEFRLSKPELDYWFIGKNPLSTYLAEHSIEAAEAYAKGKPWTRVIWDVTAVAWLLNDDDRFMRGRIMNRHVPDYDGQYQYGTTSNMMNYVYVINRDALMEDLIAKITGTIFDGNGETHGWHA